MQLFQKIRLFIKANKALSITWGVLLIIAVSVGGRLLLANHHFNFAFHLPKAKQLKTQVATVSPDELIREKNAQIIASAAKQIALPSDEQPLLATVSDKNELQNQDFFKQAENGDKILLFPKHKKAFLYRPSMDRVLAQAPLIYQDGSQDASVAAAATMSAHQDTGPVPTIKPNGKVLYNNQ